MRSKLSPTHLLTCLLALFALSAIFLTGCASMRDTLYRPVLATNSVPATVVTNYVTLQTNLIEVPAVIDAQGNVLTSAQTIERIVEVPLAEPLVVTNPPRTIVVTNAWEKRPEVFETANVVGTAVPGWGTLAAGLFGAVGTLGAAWLNRKQKGTEAALVGTIQGIDEIRRALQQTPQGRELDAKLVESLERAQRDHNAIDIVQRLIELHTGYTTEQVDLSKILRPAS